MRTLSAAVLVAISLAAAACDDLPVAEGATITIEVQQAPTSIAIGELADAAVTVTDSKGTLTGVDDEGTLYCWGRNFWHSLGLGYNDSAPRPVPTRIVEPGN
jgi:Regulator of chromosome condensation (RCC1) repeat